MMKHLPIIFFDLDDTIFETKSINSDALDEVMGSFKIHLNETYSIEETELILQDIWSCPFQDVIKRYSLSFDLVRIFDDLLTNTSLNLEITAYPDFNIITKITTTNFLITTGNSNFQWAKIKALKIESVFKEIFINDPLNHSEGKKEIFSKIIVGHSYDKDNIWVIGDNIYSEIKSGKELGLKTILFKKAIPDDSTIRPDFTAGSYKEVYQIIMDSVRS